MSATGRRPAFGCFLGFLHGLLEEGGPPLCAGPPSSTVQVKPGRASPGGSWSGLRRGGGRSGQADRMGRDEVGEPRRVNCRGDARQGGLGRGRRVVGAEHVAGSGRRLVLERFGCLGFWGVGGDGAAVCWCRLSCPCRFSSSV